MHVLSLVDDALLQILTHLVTIDILRARQTCKHLHALTYHRSVWLTVYQRDVVAHALPFPYPPSIIPSFTAKDLEHHIRHALGLHEMWSCGRIRVREAYVVKAEQMTAVTDVRLYDDLLFTLSKGIWNVIKCWYVGGSGHSDKAGDGGKLLGQWTCRGALVQDIVVNDDMTNEGALAISIKENEKDRIEIHSVDREGPVEAVFAVISVIYTSQTPMSLSGYVLASSDSVFETRLIDWRNGQTLAILKGSNVLGEAGVYDKCLNVVLLPKFNAVVVGRARSLSVFMGPFTHNHLNDGAEVKAPAVFQPVTKYSFGWIKDISIAPLALLPCQSESLPRLMIMFHAEIEDPWLSDILKIGRYILEPNLDRNSPDPSTTSPYIFPPRPLAPLAMIDGPSLCSTVILGGAGSAIWVRPRPPARLRRAHVGRFRFDEHGHPHFNEPVHEGDQERLPGERINDWEGLCTSLFPGPLLDSSSPPSDPEVKEFWENANSSDNIYWTALDYDESRGRIAVGRSDGTVNILNFA